MPAAPIDGGGVDRRRLDEDYAWLKELAGVGLTGDKAKALIYTRETGVVDNTACRDFSGLVPGIPQPCVAGLQVAGQKSGAVMADVTFLDWVS